MTPAKGYTEMKDSGIEWVGEIPRQWEITCIKRAFDIMLGKMLQPNRINEKDTIEYYLCAANIKWSGIDTSVQKQMWFSNEEKDQYLLNRGDLLVMEGGLAGTACSYDGEFAPCYIQNSVHRCRGKSGNLERFLYYWMNTIYSKGYIDSICNKATIQHYTKEKVKATPLLLPPLEDQQSIVSFLDIQCAKIDEIIQEVKASIEDYKQWKASIIYEAVTKGLDPDVKMKDSGVPCANKIPKHWIVTRFGKVATVKSNLVNPKGYLNYKQVSPENIEKDSGCLLECGTVEESGVISDNHLFFQGQILYSKIRPTLNKVVIAPFDGLCSADMYPIDTEHCSRFILYLMLSPYFKEQVALVTGNRVKMPKINQNELSQILVIIPPPSEEQQIARYLDSFCTQVDELISEKQSLITDLESYKKSLVYEAVTGKRKVV